MRVVLEGIIDCFDDGGYERPKVRLNGELIDTELSKFEDKKVRITIEEID